MCTYSSISEHDRRCEILSKQITTPALSSLEHVTYFMVYVGFQNISTEFQSISAPHDLGSALLVCGEYKSGITGYLTA